jgi:hypothetical protein
VTGSGNSLRTKILVSSPSSGTNIADAAEVTECDADVHFTKMDFSGGVTAAILDMFEGMVRDHVEGQVGDRATYYAS